MRVDSTALLNPGKRRGWKKVKVEFTGGPLSIAVPPDCVELTMAKGAALKNPRKEIDRILSQPIGSPGFRRSSGPRGSRPPN